LKGLNRLITLTIAIAVTSFISAFIITLSFFGAAPPIYLAVFIISIITNLFMLHKVAEVYNKDTVIETPLSIKLEGEGKVNAGESYEVTYSLIVEREEIYAQDMTVSWKD
jgi:hypothetical protein